MKNKPKVSVVMPVYNHGKFVGRAINSVLEQTFKDFEIIIIDDGSTDNTFEEIKKFKDSRIRFFRSKKNRGISASMNYCIGVSSGEYIAHLNADDAFMPEKIEKQVAFMDQNKNFGAVFTHVKLIDDCGKSFDDRTSCYYYIFKQRNRSRFEWLNYFFYKGNCLCHPSAFIRRECFDEVGFYDRRFHQMQDVEMWVRICLKYKIHILEEELTKFGVVSGKGNVSADTPASRIRCAWEATKILEHFLKLKASEIEEIFPEINQFKRPLDDSLVPYYLAMFAIKKRTFVHDHFAMETLYNFFGNPQGVIKLEEQYGLNSQEFISLAGKIDFFRILEVEKITGKKEKSKVFKKAENVLRYTYRKLLRK